MTLSAAVADTVQLPISEQIPTTYVFGVMTSTGGSPARTCSLSTGPLPRNRTGPTLALAITLRDGRSFVSSGNECVVDLDRARDTGIEGSLDCTALTSSTGAVDATGMFEATP